MRVLEDHHSRSCGLCCWFERKYTVADFLFFLNVNITFKVYIFNDFGNIICLVSLQ